MSKAAGKPRARVKACLWKTGKSQGIHGHHFSLAAEESALIHSCCLGVKSALVDPGGGGGGELMTSPAAPATGPEVTQYLCQQQWAHGV